MQRKSCIRTTCAEPANGFDSAQRKATDAYLQNDLGNGECLVSCPSAECQGGAIMVDGHIFTCPECKSRYCFSCEVPMHEALSCTAFLELRQKREGEKAEEEKLALQTVEEKSKPCPQCKIRLQKNGGCDHFTCKSHFSDWHCFLLMYPGSMCRHEFCWECFAPYRGPKRIWILGNGSSLCRLQVCPSQTSSLRQSSGRRRGAALEKPTSDISNAVVGTHRILSPTGHDVDHFETLGQITDITEASNWLGRGL